MKNFVAGHGHIPRASALRTPLRKLLALHLLAICLYAGAQTSASDPQSGASASRLPDLSGLLNRHPAGSIQSVDAADRALSEAGLVRAQIEDMYVRDQRDCYPKFFTSACLDDAKERRRAMVATVHPIEVEANSYKRHNRVAERNQALEERRIEDEAKGPERTRLQLEAEAKLAARTEAAAQAEKKTAESAAQPTAGTERAVRNAAQGKDQATHEVKRKEAKPGSQIDAASRAKNVADYDKKVADALIHQREVAARKAEKDREREARSSGKSTEASAPGTGK